MMRFLKAALAAVTLTAAIACTERQAPVLDSEAYSFHDPARQEQFKQKLTAAGVPFTTETLWTDRSSFVGRRVTHGERNSVLDRGEGWPGVCYLGASGGQ